MFSEPFSIDGQKFSRTDLLDHAQQGAGAPAQPKWKKKFYSFVLDLLSDDRPIAQQTSGTTGKPKVFKLDRIAMIRSAGMTISHFGLRPGDRALLCLPVDYIAGKMMVVRAFAGQLDLCTTEPAGNPLRDLEQRIDFAAIVPLQVFEAMETPELVDRFIGTLLIGGGEINNALRTKLTGLNETKVFETFAMTETLTHFAARRINGPEADALFRTMEGVTIGQDERGCLTVDVAGITGGTIATNDLVKINGTHSFEWLGRYDNVINTGGIKVIPEVLEDKIRELTAIKNDLVILAKDDEKLGQKVILVIEAADGEIDIVQLRSTLKSGLQKHEIYKEIHLIRSFPRNSAMKIERRKIKELIS